MFEDRRFQASNGLVEPIEEVKNMTELRPSFKKFVTTKVQHSPTKCISDNGAFSTWISDKPEKELLEQIGNEEIEAMKKTNESCK